MARPKKEKELTRSHLIAFRLTDVEYDLVTKMAQEQTAELVGCNTQYYKNLGNGCGMPSVPMFCRIMRALNISADDYIYPNENRSIPVYQSLIHLLSQCNKHQLSVLLATAEALLRDDNTE